MTLVMGPHTTTLRTVEESELVEIAKREDWLSGFESVSELDSLYREAARTRIETYRRMAEAARNRDEQAVGEAKAEHDLASNELQLVNPAVERVIRHAADYRLLRRWHKAIALFVIGVALTSIGVSIFASETTNGPAVPAAAESPVRVRVSLTESATKTYQERLGSACDAKSFQPTAIDTSNGKTTVLVTDAKCQPVELALTTTKAFASVRLKRTWTRPSRSCTTKPRFHTPRNFRRPSPMGRSANALGGRVRLERPRHAAHESHRHGAQERASR